MAEPLEFKPSYGSAETHLQVAKNRLENAKAELQRLIEENKPEAMIQQERELINRLEQGLADLEKELPKAA